VLCMCRSFFSNLPVLFVSPYECKRKTESISPGLYALCSSSDDHRESKALNRTPHLLLSIDVDIEGEGVTLGRRGEGVTLGRRGATGSDPAIVSITSGLRRRELRCSAAT
jgi:hypothetical protein